MLRRFSGCALMAAAAACSPSQESAQIEVSSPWARPTLAAGGTSAAYLTINNSGGGDDRLLTGSSDFAARVTLHSTTRDGGIARMRPLTDGLPVPAGETVKLEPGGSHIMLEDLKRPLAAGERIPITLRFERSGTRLVQAEVSHGPAHGSGAGHEGH